MSWCSGDDDNIWGIAQHLVSSVGEGDVVAKSMVKW